MAVRRGMGGFGAAAILALAGAAGLIVLTPSTTSVIPVATITVWFPEIECGSHTPCTNGGGLAGRIDSSKHTLEDYLEGKAPCVVAATQRRGGSAALYGCLIESPELAAAVGSLKPLKICALDIYAEIESEGRIGANGKLVRGGKLDLALRPKSRFAEAATSVKNLRLTCLHKVPEQWLLPRP